jgi:hypothetical protein
MYGLSVQQPPSERKTHSDQRAAAVLRVLRDEHRKLVAKKKHVWSSAENVCLTCKAAAEMLHHNHPR